MASEPSAPRSLEELMERLAIAAGSRHPDAEVHPSICALLEEARAALDSLLEELGQEQNDSKYWERQTLSVKAELNTALERIRRAEQVIEGQNDALEFERDRIRSLEQENAALHISCDWAGKEADKARVETRSAWHLLRRLERETGYSLPNEIPPAVVPDRKEQGT